MRSAERITPHANSDATISPFASRSRIALTTSRSSFGFSEQIPLESSSGSMGTARFGKYTEVPRRRASRSSAEPRRT